MRTNNNIKRISSFVFTANYPIIPKREILPFLDGYIFNFQNTPNIENEPVIHLENYGLNLN